MKIGMIAVEEALNIISKHVKTNTVQKVKLIDALDAVLAEAVFSPIPVPPFRQSAMDGYAIRYSEVNQYKIVGEIKAGDNKDFQLKEAEAVRIFTGARVPDNADTVIMKEHVESDGNSIEVNRNKIKKDNIRKKGEQVQAGAVALEKGALLNSAAIAYLSGLGVAELNVYKDSRAAILITGNELQAPGTPLELGNIYDSNSIMLKTLLKKAGVDIVDIFFVEDTLNESVDVVKKAIEKYDIIVASGGISVGDYDLMRDSFEKNEVEELFYKINQKPGKPIYFGKKEDTLVFGLPGNPAACFINFQVYVIPALFLQMGKEEFVGFRSIKTAKELVNSSNKALFLRGRKEDNNIVVFENQSSAMLKSLVNANVLVYVPEGINKIEKGEEVRYLDILQ
ncbi:molybdopterin molybdotransferase MoeA [Galbibacter sp. EGI 63066]|uniref:molybdopterin molybdotransferase MoeA n=1 Tax=Galbibacter sp. EGI 63066 TaxID=2993559 RepID=UPI00224890E9|nr:gephyrin-like molybdotransferase Glp [Galbibacter sp. EGI 63066]MCX2679203.1 molybdopterin molybdotransferase MoeA [Galbibacter sp. EGI 63066]